MYSATFYAFGRKTGTSADWFEANRDELRPIIDVNRNALGTYKASPSESNLQALCTACSKVPQISRHCAYDYWLKLCSRIQFATNIGNIGNVGWYQEVPGSNLKEGCPPQVHLRQDHPGLDHADGALGRALLIALCQR